MPRQVDHDERRHQIAEAVWRLAIRGGLEQVTLRQVAAEAGVSARLLQYYFGTRDQLLLGALEILNTDAEQQAKHRMASLGDAPSMRAIVRGVLLEMLPLDEPRRDRHVVYAAYFVRFLTEPALGTAARATPPELENLVTDLITHAQQLGEAPHHIDASAEAVFLIAGADGLQTRLLLGQLSPEYAIDVVDQQLDRIFTRSGSPNAT
ncbi:TetR family transcriptional regulator C-terminal domain-containing protein [Nocardia sp. CA2R105]|uniref:TetR/AcrR family transcriptional regulator n=1 Tax=Nocardia coffeae TaxID=2873381 RepID=UPI001CA67E69|nr:TetR family transcriptional regulator C-terminal domain-containing protein [Nocardia coffeae]MBY8864017.1 TetR family transcriptional regulator C-terminal domain-containing protein [Nocardia coffeae]